MRQHDDFESTMPMRPRNGRTRPERPDLASKRKRDRDRRKARRLRNVTRRP